MKKIISETMFIRNSEKEHTIQSALESGQKLKERQKEVVRRRIKAKRTLVQAKPKFELFQVKNIAEDLHSFQLVL
jgi:hypothetical protein